MENKIMYGTYKGENVVSYDNGRTWLLAIDEDYEVENPGEVEIVENN